MKIDPLCTAQAYYSVQSSEWLYTVLLSKLLNKKSLYQSVNIQEDDICKVFLSESRFTLDEKTKNEVLGYLNGWLSVSESAIYKDDFQYKFNQNFYQIKLPQTVKTYCELCKSVTVHNPISYGDCYTQKGKQNFTHVFHAEYECQDCKASNVSFMVMRRGLKFQLMGRSPIELVSLTKEFTLQLSKEEYALFAEALMASKTGSELASVCLLRVALESYLRRMTDNKDTANIVSGEELYEQYKKKLPDDFPNERVVSLGKIYNDLSAVMHSAKVHDGCFKNNYDKIMTFFKFLSLMPLVDNK